MTETVDVIVIGAGAVGLAIARRFALAGREVLLLEKNAAFGEETSSRNSEVIHAGLYYRPGGMRARFCHPGKQMLYRYCRDRNVAHLDCGKLIVAHGEDEITTLAHLKATSEKNGVVDLHLLSRSDAKAMEPLVECEAALFSPSTGIIDSHGLMLSLLGDFEQAGGLFVVKTPVVSGVVKDNSLILKTGGADPIELRAQLVINSAGLWADRLARAIDGVPPDTIPRLHYGKGQYFSYAGRAPFSHLIYPVPGRDSLGAHYTRDLGGHAKLGPDISYVNSNTDYGVDESRRGDFAAAVHRFWPSLDPDKLTPGYAGIRPKTAGPGEEGDFIIQGPRSHGVRGYIGLYGMESPALTSCLAIAEHIAELAR
ncbi:MAG: NAD(P)/FAD-dependent oxidoreductase [Pseudomonadota bacterium]